MNLQLPPTRTSPASAEELAVEVQRWQQINVGRTSVAAAIVEHLRDRADARHLSLVSTTGELPDQLGMIKALTHLTVDLNQHEVAGAATIGHLLGLQRLTVEDGTFSSAESWEFLRPLGQLRTLDLASCTLHSPAPQWLSSENFPHLKALALPASAIEPSTQNWRAGAMFDRLSELPAVESIRLLGLNSARTAAAIESLSQLPQLTYIELETDANVQLPASATDLRRFPNLRLLEVHIQPCSATSTASSSLGAHAGVQRNHPITSAAVSPAARSYSNSGSDLPQRSRDLRDGLAETWTAATAHLQDRPGLAINLERLLQRLTTEMARIHATVPVQHSAGAAALLNAVAAAALLNMQAELANVHPSHESRLGGPQCNLNLQRQVLQRVIDDVRLSEMADMHKVLGHTCLQAPDASRPNPLAGSATSPPNFSATQQAYAESVRLTDHAALLAQITDPRQTSSTIVDYSLVQHAQLGFDENQSHQLAQELGCVFDAIRSHLPPRPLLAATGQLTTAAAPSTRAELQQALIRTRGLCENQLVWRQERSVARNMSFEYQLSVLRKLHEQIVSSELEQPFEARRQQASSSSSMAALPASLSTSTLSLTGIVDGPTQAVPPVTLADRVLRWMAIAPATPNNLSHSSSRSSAVAFWQRIADPRDPAFDPGAANLSKFLDRLETQLASVQQRHQPLVAERVCSMLNALEATSSNLPAERDFRQQCLAHPAEFFDQLEHAMVTLHTQIAAITPLNLLLCGHQLFRLAKTQELAESIQRGAESDSSVRSANGAVMQAPLDALVWRLICQSQMAATLPLPIMSPAIAEDFDADTTQQLIQTILKSEAQDIGAAVHSLAHWGPWAHYAMTQDPARSDTLTRSSAAAAHTAIEKFTLSALKNLGRTAAATAQATAPRNQTSSSSSSNLAAAAAPPPSAYTAAAARHAAQVVSRSAAASIAPLLSVDPFSPLVLSGTAPPPLPDQHWLPFSLPDAFLDAPPTFAELDAQSALINAHPALAGGAAPSLHALNSAPSWLPAASLGLSMPAPSSRSSPSSNISSSSGAAVIRPIAALRQAAVQSAPYLSSFLTSTATPPPSLRSTPAISLARTPVTQASQQLPLDSLSPNPALGGPLRSDSLLSSSGQAPVQFHGAVAAREVHGSREVRTQLNAASFSTASSSSSSRASAPSAQNAQASAARTVSSSSGPTVRPSTTTNVARHREEPASTSADRNVRQRIAEPSAPPSQPRPNNSAQ